MAYNQVPCAVLERRAKNTLSCPSGLNQVKNMISHPKLSRSGHSGHHYENGLAALQHEQRETENPSN